MRLRPLAFVLGALACALPASAAADEPAKTKTEAPPEERVRYTLQGVEISGNTRTAAKVILRHVRFKAGDVLDVADPEIELTRYRLLGTGFFSSVELSLRKGSQRGTAVLVIAVTERNTLVVQNLWLGVAADEDTSGSSKPLSAFVGLQVAETNLLGTGIALGAGVGLAEDQLALRFHIYDPAFAGTSWSGLLSVLYTDARDFFGNRGVKFESPLLDQKEVTDYAVVAYKRFGATIGAGHALSAAATFQLEYHLEQVTATVPTAASHLRGNTREPIDFSIRPGKSVLSTLRASITYDTRDTPLLTRRGLLAMASLTAGVPPLGSDYGYARVELSAQRWWELPWKHVVRASFFAGGIAGKAPFFEKFYVGDFTDLLPDRVLDLAPDRRQPPNFLNTDIIEVRYGDFAAKAEGEYRVPIYTGRNTVYGIDLFGSFGFYGVAARRDLTDPPSGYHGFRRVPIDLTYNLGLRFDTSLGGATLAFSNILGLIPAHNGVRQ
ncbi:MAG: BamA/TamA family outer membrane protein [Minicystis sp.]